MRDITVKTYNSNADIFLDGRCKSISCEGYNDFTYEENIEGIEDELRAAYDDITDEEVEYILEQLSIWVSVRSKSEQIIIDLDNLKVNTQETDGRVTSRNNSGLYYIEGTNSDGEPTEEILTRMELKKVADVDRIDDTLEQISCMDFDKVWTDDDMNYITEREYNALSEAFKVGYKRVEWIKINE